MTTTPHDAPSLRAAYEHDPSAVLRGAWRLSWWRRGGEPGPDWTSDKVDLSAAQGHVAGQYTRARNAPTPPFAARADEHTGPVPSALADGVLRAMFTTRLFEQTLPAEGRGNLADAVTHTVELSYESLHFRKDLYEPGPDEIGAWVQAFEAVAEQLTREGVARDVTRR